MTFDPELAETEFNLLYLQAELARIDLLIRREVNCWQRAGQDFNDAFRGLTVSTPEAEALAQHAFGASWGQTIALTPAEEEQIAATQRQVEAHNRSLLAAHPNKPPRLVQLVNNFGLNQFELDSLLIGLAPAVDLRYERLYGFLQDDVTRRWPTINLILNLLASSGPDRLRHLVHFADEAPLMNYQLLQRATDDNGELPLLAQPLQVDATVVAWLLGRYQTPALFKEHITLSHPQPAKALLPEPMASALTQRWPQGARPLLIFSGPDQMAQAAAIHFVVAQTDCPLLQVDLAAIVKDGSSPAEALRLALRDSRLTGAALGLLGWEACLLSDNEPGLPASVWQELDQHPQLIIVASQNKWPAKELTSQRDIFWTEFPLPPYSRRLSLWRHFLAQESANTEVELAGVAGQFALTTEQLRDAAQLAQRMAAQANEPLQERHLFAASRTNSNSRLAELARKITPRYIWSDLILPPNRIEILQEIVATIRNRPLVLEEWGVAHKLVPSKGITILFGGPPGTGKTMAAEVIAGELGLDLYKIDLSTVVSKYIGETEKNLEKIFSEAASSNAILFFDEADAIFGKRSEVQDAHDRYANIEVSYLLQRMEAYDGVTFLATNLRANVDEAFTRRLHFAVDFPEPKAADRQRIWQTLFPPSVPQAPNLAFDLLAERFKLPGGNIRNVIVSAAYLAANDGGRVTMEHVMHGVRREFQKMGRLVDEAELQVEQQNL